MVLVMVLLVMVTRILFATSENAPMMKNAKLSMDRLNAYHLARK